jgi:hypothetical protein
VDHDTLTRCYLDEIARSGVTAAETVGALREQPLLESLRHGQYLSRPLFLGRQERDTLHADVENVRVALLSLPDRLFDGDLAAFARAVGASEGMVSAAVRGRVGQMSGLTRADLYLEASGFKLLELNLGSVVAGIENADICRTLLRHPVIAGFAAEHHLGFADTMRAQVESIFAETDLAPGSAPVIAIASDADLYQRVSDFLHAIVPRWAELGLDSIPCKVGELQAGPGGLWVKGRRVDAVFRMFMLENVPSSGAAPIDLVLDAAARGEVAVYTSIDGELYSSKVALALLSDHRHRPLFSAAELASIDRIVPWTRLVRPGPDTLEDGSTVELMDYAAGHASDLVLKPALLHGGAGIVPGWDSSLSQRAWQDHLAAACGQHYVLQRRVRPVPELMPSATGELEPWIVTWGAFTIMGEHGGIYIRGVPERTGHSVINFTAGASVGAGLAVQAQAAGA